MTVINKKASTCPSCRAVKGYIYDSRYGVLGKTAIKLWFIILPIFIFIIVASSSAQTPSYVYLTIPWAIFGIIKLKKGSKWYQTKHI